MQILSKLQLVQYRMFLSYRAPEHHNSHRILQMMR